MTPVTCCPAAGYFVGLYFAASPGAVWVGWPLLALCLSALLALAALLRWRLWQLDDHRRHPLVTVLTSYSETGLWRQPAAEVNREFRRSVVAAVGQVTSWVCVGR